MCSRMCSQVGSIGWVFPMIERPQAHVAMLRHMTCAERICRLVSSQLPPGFRVEPEGVDQVTVYRGQDCLGTVGGAWECVLRSVEDLVSQETTEPFEIN